jgi:hypothetical protein
VTTIAPQLSTPFPTNRRTWKCEKTGLVVPMREDENVAYRESLLHKAARDPVMQRDLLAACRQSCLYWINTFAYTSWEMEVNPETHGYVTSPIALHPFICFERQDEMVEFLIDCFTKGHDGLIDKSRDMGASWLIALFIHWLWLFGRENLQLREMSRVEDLVDSPIAKSLFYKHDTVNTYLPEWMCPPDVLVRGRGNRTNMRIYNALNGSTIAGESTNQSAFSGDRAALILLDEMAKMKNGESIKRSTAAVTPCRIVNSTVDMPGSCYSNWKNSGTIKVFSLMFWDHPRKGAGRFVVQDEVTKEYRITSPFAEHEIERNGWKEVAKELYALEGAVGDTFFTNTDLDKHAVLFGKEPMARFNIKLRNDDKLTDADVARIVKTRDVSKVSMVRATEGDLEVYVPLNGGRLDQSKSYIIGCDISKGQGGGSTSETVFSIKCKQTGEKVAVWASNTTPPYKAPRIFAALALWVGGAAPQRLPFAIWEMNGPGWDFGTVLVNDLHYPHYYRDEAVGQVGTKKTAKWGWHSSRDKKFLLLRAYERAMREGKFVNHDKRSLDQAKTYIQYPQGGCGPAELTDKDKAEYLGHGDRVIADALTVMDKEVMAPKKDAMPDAQAGTWGARYQQWQRSQKKNKHGWQQPFSFR